MTFHVEVNAFGSFSTLEQARMTAQAVEVLLSSGNGKHGAVKIYEPATRGSHSVHLPVIDRSKVVKGRQETEEKVTKYVKFIEDTRPEGLIESSTADEFWGEFIASSIQVANIDFERLEVLAGERHGDAELGLQLVSDAVAKAAADEVTRALRTAKAQRAREAKFAAQADRQNIQKNRKKN